MNKNILQIGINSNIKNKYVLILHTIAHIHLKIKNCTCFCLAKVRDNMRSYQETINKICAHANKENESESFRMVSN